MDPPPRPNPVDWPSGLDRDGWTGAELTKTRVAVDLDDEQRDALRRRVAEIGAAGLPLHAVTHARFAHPALDPAMHRVALQLKQGTGLVFLRGLPVVGCDSAALRLMFWGLSTYFGLAVSQSGRGDRLGEVVAGPDAGPRGYTSDRALHFHNDLAEIFGLFCIERARTGGETLFASMLRAHRILERAHPEHLPVLARGFRLDRTPDSPHFAAEPFSPYPIPLFSTLAGLRSCWLTLPERALRCARSLGLELGRTELAALEALQSIIEAPGFAFQALLEPGEAVFVNNYEIVHARTGFVQHDDPARRRHLLRIWLQDIPPRPMVPELALYRNPSGRQGIDPV
jgi:alpha-ketoglutarate-dependent taurine dioxygenase